MRGYRTSGPETANLPGENNVGNLNSICRTARVHLFFLVA